MKVAAIRRNLVRSQPFARAVSLWCRNQPQWYCKWVFSGLGVSPTRLSSPVSSVTNAVIQDFVSRLLQTHRSAIFLMSDARSLAATYAASGGEAIFCKFLRRTLPWPKEEHYLDLFDVVNRAALEAMTLPRKPFSRCYRRALNQYLASTPVMASMLKQHVRMLLTTQATAIADTGMQGTFALRASGTNRGSERAKNGGSPGRRLSVA